jgi:hypothetical protein
MPVKTLPLIPNRVLMVKFSGDVTFEDMVEGNDAGVTMIKHCPEGILFHTIIDSSEVQRFPIDLRMVTSDAAGSFRKEPNLGWTLLVTKNRIIIYLASFAASIVQNRFRTFNTLEEALEFLKEQDLTLDWSYSALASQ